MYVAGRVSIPYSTIKIAQGSQPEAQVCHVSIPYSTIKIRETLRMQTLDKVSIPYSTIKIQLLPVWWQPLLPFQFLIVRLKSIAVSYTTTDKGSFNSL